MHHDTSVPFQGNEQVHTYTDKHGRRPQPVLKKNVKSKYM